MNNPKRQIIFTISFILVTVGIFGFISAVPAAPGPRNLTQPNGNTFIAEGFGDECTNWVETLDGYSIIQNLSNEYWTYALKKDTILIPSNFIVTIANPEELNLTKHLVPDANKNCNQVGVANPSSTYCLSLGYNLTNGEGGGFCIFPDKTECEEWKFYRGKCGQEWSYCTLKSYDLKNLTNNEGWGEGAICINKTTKEEVGNVFDLITSNPLINPNNSTESKFNWFWIIIPVIILLIILYLIKYKRKY